WPSNVGLTGFWHVNANPASGYALLQDGSGNTYLNSAGALDFRIGNVTKMYMLSNGNVGINTVTPSATLEVAGTAKVSNIQVTGGSPSAGRVLTATDASGNTTWSTPQSPLVLKDFYTDASSYSHTVPAGRLATNGDKIRFFVGGKFETTQLGFFSMGVGVTTVGSLNITSGNWKAEVEIIRTSNSSVRVVYTALHSEASGTEVKMTDVTGLDLSGSGLYLSTYTDHSASTVCQMGSITYLPSAPIP
ncbi:MAG TPA: hypothetical protein VEC37_08115, partial [Bacillota bacterium]|nr:hypothetical protein [Bacillota bacterium]